MKLPTQYNQRKLIAERLALRSGLPFDQAYKACLVIEDSMAKAIVGKACKLWQGASKTSRYANSAIYLRGAFRIDMYKDLGLIDKSKHGQTINVKLVQGQHWEAALNKGKLLYKQTRPRGIDKRWGIYRQLSKGGKI